MIRSKKNRTRRFNNTQLELPNDFNLLEDNTEDIEAHSKTERALPPTASFYVGKTTGPIESPHKTYQIIDYGQKELLTEIIEVTETIRETFSAFYELLSETPLFICKQNGDINTADFEQYLESLKTQLDRLNSIPTLKLIA